MTRVPACPGVAPCPPPSRALRAGFAGGLTAILDRGEHDAWGQSGRGEETAQFNRTKKHPSARQILHNLTDTTRTLRLIML